MNKLTGAEWIVKVLAAEGVTHVFGIPGSHNLAIYDLLLQDETIRHVLTRHEQGAAFMADGYARATGKPGVVLVTTGPAAINTLSPLVESFASSIPVVVLMSDIASRLVGRNCGALHEVTNQIECFRNLTRWCKGLVAVSEIPGALHDAFRVIRTGRPGPVALSFPNDLLSERTEGALSPGGGAPSSSFDEVALRDAVARLKHAAKPLLISGGGIIAAAAEEEIVRLAERVAAPVITTVMGRGSMPENHPLWLGVLPNRHATERALEQADVILAVGTRLSFRSTQGVSLKLKLRPDQALIHLDIDATVPGIMYHPTIALIGDAKAGLCRILTELGEKEARSPWKVPSFWRSMRIHSARYTREMAQVIKNLRDVLADDAILVNDQSNVNYWLEWYFPVLRPRTFLYPVGSSTLGYSLPAAIGAKIGCPERQVVAITGDGGFLFTVQELATAVKYNLSLVVILFNDNCYGGIRWLQNERYGRSGEVDLVNPDFQLLARAFGANGIRVNSLSDLPAVLRSALAAEGPTVLEVPVTEELSYDIPLWKLILGKLPRKL